MSSLRYQFLVRNVAGSNPAEYVFCHLHFSLASRSSQHGIVYTNYIKHEHFTEVIGVLDNRYD